MVLECVQVDFPGTSTVFVFQLRYRFGLSPVCPDNRPLPSPVWGLFPLEPLKGGVRFCALPSPFSCFSPFVSMWRHCKSGAADSGSGAWMPCTSPWARVSQGSGQDAASFSGQKEEEGGCSVSPGCADVGTGPGAHEQHLISFPLSQDTSKAVPVFFFSMHPFGCTFSFKKQFFRRGLLLGPSTWWISACICLSVLRTSDGSRLCKLPDTQPTS